MSFEVVKCAGDTKLLRLIKSREGNKELQKKINKLDEWATWWQMKFSVDICKLIYFGEEFLIYLYTLLGSKLIVSKGKDLDIIFDSSIKTSSQCAAAVKKIRIHKEWDGK